MLGTVGDVDHPLGVDVELFQPLDNWLGWGVADCQLDLDLAAKLQSVISCDEVADRQDSAIILGLGSAILNEAPISKLK